MSKLKNINRLFTRKDIEAILRSVGETVPAQTTFSYWTQSKKALVPPAEKRASRLGGDRWDVAGVVLIRWILRLRKDNVTFQKVRVAFSYLHAELPAALADPHPWAFVVGAGRRPILVRRGDEVGIELVRYPGQAVFLDAVSARHTAGAVEAFARKRAAA